MADQPTLIVLAGPTAIGKTAAAIRLAQALNTEIISSDSRQFYRELSIGTAKPTPEERAAVPHHFIDSLSIHDAYSAGDYERDVLRFLTDYFKDHQTVVMTGGSGLFIKAVTKGFDDLPSDIGVRAALMKQLEDDGIVSLQQELKERDPAHYGAMDIHNPQRLVRALEVCRISERPFSAFRQDAAKARPFNTLFVGLTADREIMYERINRRVDQMVENGLEAEARNVYAHRELNALNTVGYKEWFAHFDGELDRDTTIEKIKQHTRNFAKRQMTWFRKNTDIHWFAYTAVDDMIAFVREQIDT